jgi:hypothetical protein
MERGCGKLFYLRDDAITMQFQLRSFLSEFNAFSDTVNRVVFFVAGTAVLNAGLAYSVHVYLEVAMPSKGLSRFPSKTPARRHRDSWDKRESSPSLLRILPAILPVIVDQQREVFFNLTKVVKFPAAEVLLEEMRLFFFPQYFLTIDLRKYKVQRRETGSYTCRLI